MAEYNSPREYVSAFKRAARERDVPAIMEMAGDGTRYLMLPVALAALAKATYGNVPDSMVTQSLTYPAIVFGVGEGLRSAGYLWREAKNKTLSAVNVAAALTRAAMPFLFAYNVSDGSETVRQAIGDTFVPSAIWGMANATGSEHKKKE